MTLGNRYTRFDFEIREDGYCCGIFNIGGLYFTGGDMFSKGKPLTTSKLIQRFEEDLLQELAHNTRGDGYHSNAGYLITASINHRQEEFKEFLELCGWSLVNQFRNSNTDNTVYVFHYYVPYEYIQAYREYSKEEFDEYDDDDDDYF